MKTFSLDDLDKLSPGLSDKICTLLYEPHDYPSFLLEMNEIERLLKENRITADEVMIDKGKADGLMLQEALQYASHSYSGQKAS